MNKFISDRYSFLIQWVSQSQVVVLSSSPSECLSLFGGGRFVEDTLFVALGQRYAFRVYSVIRHLKRADLLVIYW